MFGVELGLRVLCLLDPLHPFLPDPVHGLHVLRLELVKIHLSEIQNLAASKFQEDEWGGYSQNPKGATFGPGVLVLQLRVLPIQDRDVLVFPHLTGMQGFIN